MLRPNKKSWVVLRAALDKFTEDFMKGGRKQPHIKRALRYLQPSSFVSSLKGPKSVGVGFFTVVFP